MIKHKLVFASQLFYELSCLPVGWNGQLRWKFWYWRLLNIKLAVPNEICIIGAGLSYQFFRVPTHALRALGDCARGSNPYEFGVFMHHGYTFLLRDLMYMIFEK